MVHPFVVVRPSSVASSAAAPAGHPINPIHATESSPWAIHSRK